MVPGGGSSSVLILNNLSKILEAQNYQNAENAALEYAASAQGFSRAGLVGWLWFSLLLDGDCGIQPLAQG
jgi:hypothetical protein